MPSSSKRGNSDVVEKQFTGQDQSSTSNSSVSDEFRELTPPSSVYCIGRLNSAAVWWSVVDNYNLESIVCWEVLRYRLDEGAWRLKGSVDTISGHVTHTIIEGLSNNSEYRFTVRAKGGRFRDAVGDMSMPSNSTMIEAPLPPGWFRFNVAVETATVTDTDNSLRPGKSKKSKKTVESTDKSTIITNK